MPVYTTLGYMPVYTTLGTPCIYTTWPTYLYCYTPLEQCPEKRPWAQV